MKPAQAVQPDLFAPQFPVVQSVATPKPPAAPQTPKEKSHRTKAGDGCEGSIQTPGLSHSLCDRCGTWIATSKF